MSVDYRDWPAQDDRPPYWRNYEPERPFMSLWEWLLLVAILATVGAWPIISGRITSPRGPHPPSRHVGLPAEAPLSETREAGNPPSGADPRKSKRSRCRRLDQSDALIGELVAGLVGQKLFASLVGSERLIRRIVATVDNLPRRVAPVRMRAVKPVPRPVHPGRERMRSRYEPLVKVFTFVRCERARA